MTKIPLPHQSALAWTVASTTGHAIAIGFCALRTYIRAQRDQLWWDDGLVTFTALLNVYNCVIVWISPKRAYWKDANGIAYVNNTLRFLPAYIVMWLARISMWISLARIYGPGRRTRKLALGLSYVYGCVALFLVLLGTFGCKGSAGGTRQRVDYCYSGNVGRTYYEKMTMATSVVDLVADLLLVLFPAYLLSRSALRRREKRLIIFLGCGSLLTLSTLGINTIFIYGPFERNFRDSTILITGMIHLSTYMALIAANLVVVGTAIYSRIEGSSRGDSVSQDTEADHRVNFPHGLTVVSESSIATKSTSGDPRHHMSTFLTELDMISSCDREFDNPSDGGGEGGPMSDTAKGGNGKSRKTLVLKDSEGDFNRKENIKEAIDSYFR